MEYDPSRCSLSLSPFPVIAPRRSHLHLRPSTLTWGRPRPSGANAEIQMGMMIVYVAILLLGLISVVACLAAEFKKTKAKDVKLDGTLCSLPGSSAFGLGLAASISLSAAQLIGTSTIACHFFISKQRNISTCNRAKVASVLLFLISWITYGFAIILLGVGTSMNHAQRYGFGWLQRKCYVVNDGVYAASSVLVLIAIIFMLACIFTSTATMRNRTAQGEQGRRVHAAAQGERRDRELQGMKREDA